MPSYAKDAKLWYYYCIFIHNIITLFLIKAWQY